MRKLSGLEIPDCPFANLPEVKSGRWGIDLIVTKMKDSRWVNGASGFSGRNFGRRIGCCSHGIRSSPHSVRWRRSAGATTAGSDRGILGYERLRV